MNLLKVYDNGKVLNKILYKELQSLEANHFGKIDKQFRNNRTWFVMLEDFKIIAYCGMVNLNNIDCYFNRAWVGSKHRGMGIHKLLIKKRITEARRKKLKCVVTFTLIDNCASSNNLFRMGFKLYSPAHPYVKEPVLYFKKEL